MVWKEHWTGQQYKNDRMWKVTDGDGGRNFQPFVTQVVTVAIKVGMITVHTSSHLAQECISKSRPLLY